MNFLTQSEGSEQIKNNFNSSNNAPEYAILEEEDSYVAIPIKFMNNIDISNNNDVIISFYNHLFLTFVNQASVIHQYMLQQDNPYDFVNEYCIRVNH